MYEKRPMPENYTIKSRRPSTPPKDKGTPPTTPNPNPEYKPPIFKKD